jgi:hypothetical protein
LFAAPEDRNVRLIKFTPERAEYRDTPGNVVSGVKMVFAAGIHLDPGEHEKIAL